MFALNMLADSLIQAAVFFTVPFLWWLLSLLKSRAAGRDRGPARLPFFEWIGLKKPVFHDRRRFAALFAATVLSFVGLSFLLTSGFFVDNSVTAKAQFEGMGLEALPAVLIYSFIQTGLSEEVLFRGFLGKRIAARFGFAAGNAAQAALFGLIHGVLFFFVTGPLKALAILMITGGIGWLMGYIDEKYSGGSILPSILLHGLANTVSACM